MAESKLTLGKNYLLVWLGIAAFASPVSARRYEVGPEDDWFRVLSGDGLAPGDEVRLAAGVYRDSRRLVIAHRGTAERPIVIQAAPGAHSILQRPDARQNTINLVGAQHLVLRGLEITGGSTGIRLMRSAEHPCRFVTIEGMHLHHVGGPAITANSPGNDYEGLIFRRNHIHHTSGHGEGFYLGVNNRPDGSTDGTIFDCLIEGNYIHDLNGSDISQGDGIEIKDGSYRNIIRDNVIHDTKYPGILVYGTDGKSPNVIEGNVIWNSGDHGIQAASEAVVRNNVVFGNRGDGIRSQAHQSARVGGLRILHNTVIAARPGSAAIRVAITEPNRPTGPIVIANNALYAGSGDFALRVPPPQVAGTELTIAGNAGAGAAEGLPTNTARGGWKSAGRRDRDLGQDFFPLPGGSLIGAARTEFRVVDDFNGTARGTSHDAGAFVFRPQGNPGWTIAAGFKASRTE